MQRKSKPPRSNKFEDWASPELQAAFAAPLCTFGELLRSALDHPRMRDACTALAKRAHVPETTLAYLVAEFATDTLAATLVPNETVKQRGKSLARLREDDRVLRDLERHHPNWREYLRPLHEEIETSLAVAACLPATGIDRGDHRERAIARQVATVTPFGFGKVPLKVKCRWLSCFGVGITAEQLRDAVRKAPIDRTHRKAGKPARKTARVSRN